MNSWNPNSTNKLSMLVCRCISKFIYCCLQAVFSLLSVISCICLSFYWLVWKSLQLTNIWIYKGSLYMISYIYRLFCKSLLYIHNGWWWCLKHRDMFRKLKSVVVFLTIIVIFMITIETSLPFSLFLFVWRLESTTTISLFRHLHCRGSVLFKSRR